MPGASPQSRTVSTLPPLTRISVPAKRPRFARGQPEPRHAGDARQRLPAKPQRGDGREVRARADFARRVAFQAKQGVVAVHAVPVVHHAHQRDAAALDGDLHRARPGVEAVFDEFLDDRRRPFDDLARRHLAGHDFRQQRNAAHGTKSIARRSDVGLGLESRRPTPLCRRHADRRNA